MFVLLAESHALVAIGSSVSATHWIVVFVTVTAGSGILSTLDPSEKMVKKNQNDKLVCKILCYILVWNKCISIHWYLKEAKSKIYARAFHLARVVVCEAVIPTDWVQNSRAQTGGTSTQSHGKYGRAHQQDPHIDWKKKKWWNDLPENPVSIV